MGLSDIILNGLDWRKLTYDTGIPNLSVITAGRIPPNPAELLGSNRMGAMISELKKDFDTVLLDSSPILLVSDPISLSKHIDGIIVVARCSYTTIQNLINTKNALQLTGKPIIGTILNSVPQARSCYDYGYNKYDGRAHVHRRELEQTAEGLPSGK
jgi:capsular exopolysaccharide synthesis family protein